MNQVVRGVVTRRRHGYGVSRHRVLLIGVRGDTRTPSRQAVVDVRQAAYPLFSLFGSSDGLEDRGVEWMREGAEHHEVSAPP